MNQDGDTVNVQSFDPGFHGGLTIDSGDNVGPNNVLIAGLDPGVTGAVNVETNVNTGGQALSITAGTINVDSVVTINTQSTTGNSGAISLTGANITLESGSTLNSAASSSSYQAGAVTLTVTNQDHRVLELPIDYSNKSVGVTLTGATITGGDVTIMATASDQSLSSEVPVYAQGFTSTLSNLFEQVPGELFSAATGIDTSVVLRGANANISVAKSDITSSGSVDIDSTTAVTTFVNAIDVSNNSLGFGFAVGYGQATSTVTATVTGDSQITAQNNVTIAADGTVEVKSYARASNNLIGNISSTGQSYAIALAYTNLNDTAETDSGTTITAKSGNVSVTATGNDTNYTSASTNGYVDASAGDTVVLGIDFVNTHAYLNGNVTAGGTTTGTSGPNFNATQSGVLNPTTNALYMERP